MMERYNKLLQALPDCDQEDREVYAFGLSSQFAPDYSQEAYSRMIIQEEAQRIQRVKISQGCPDKTKKQE
jgi:hypothetical protein